MFALLENTSHAPASDTWFSCHAKVTAEGWQKEPPGKRLPRSENALPNHTWLSKVVFGEQFRTFGSVGQLICTTHQTWPK